MTVDEFRRLKSEVDEVRRKLDRTVGAVEEAERALKELGYSSVEEAEKFLIKEEKELSVMREELTKREQEFRDRWKGKLE